MDGRTDTGREVGVRGETRQKKSIEKERGMSGPRQSHQRRRTKAERTQARGGKRTDDAPPPSTARRNLPSRCAPSSFRGHVAPSASLPMPRRGRARIPAPEVANAAPPGSRHVDRGDARRDVSASLLLPQPSCVANGSASPYQRPAATPGPSGIVRQITVQPGVFPGVPFPRW